MSAVVVLVSASSSVRAHAPVVPFNSIYLSGYTKAVTATADADEACATNAAGIVTLNLYVRGSYVYDADGNLVYMNRGNKDYTYTYDALGRLVAATLRDSAGNGWNWNAAYDALGRRVKTEFFNVTSGVASPASCAVYLYDPLCPEHEIYREDETWEHFYLYGPDLSDTVGGLGGIGGLIAYRENGYPLQILTDIRGDVLGYIDYGIYDFNPWYTAFGINGTPDLRAPSFHTRRVDETGLIYMGARYYDPATGRFLSPDPSRFTDSRNLYALTGNDPVNKADPDGLLGKGFAKGATLGDYASYRNTAQAVGGFVGQLAVNFTPAGWAGDVRDFSAAVGQVRSEGLSWRTGAGVVLSGVAFAPVLGDALKGVAKPLLKAADDVPVSAISRAADNLVTPTSPVIIGENMKRVNDYARGIGAETIDDWLAGRKWTPQLNDEFIAAMKAQGRQIQDIGPDFSGRLQNRIDPDLGRPPSSVYGRERQSLLGYENHLRLYERTGKYQGGVPGFDP